jgi:DNA polymerase elongation subunit (family B)
MYNFRINNCDTDSISFNKKDNTPFSLEERTALLKEMNDISPDKILWEDDGYYDCVVILKAKNYILYDGKKIKTKGSALKSAKLEIACKEFQQEIIKAIIHETGNYDEIYKRYIKEACSVTKDTIKRWSGKKTYTKKIDESTRANETKQLAALQGSNYKEGDKYWLFFLEDGSLRLAENFEGNYDKLKMCEKLYKSAQVFSNVIPVDQLFVNYKLKKNKAALDKLLET